MSSFKPYNYIFLLTVSLFVCYIGRPQSSQALPGRYYVEHFGEEEGLPQNSVNCILADRNDFLWIATEGGITRFNGNRFLNVPLAANITGRNFTRIKGFYFKAKDTILAFSAANNRVAVIVNNKIVAIEKMEYSKHGMLFLNRHNTVSMPAYIANRSLSENDVAKEWDITDGGYFGTRHNKDTFLVATYNGVGIYDSKGKTGEIKISNKNPKRVLFVNGQVIYVDNENYIYYYSLSGFQKKELIPIPVKGELRVLSNSFGNNFFCVADSVLYQVDISSGKLNVRKILTNLQHGEDITTVYQKDSNTIVTGTLRNGLYVYKKQYFQITDILPKGESDAFYGQALLADGQTILAGRDKLFRNGRYIGKTTSVFTTSLYATLKDRKGNYWYTFYDYILRAKEIGVAPDTMINLKIAPGMLCEDRQGNVWVYSTQHFGYFSNDKFTELKFNNLNAGSISYMQQDLQGRYMIGTREGLFILKDINEPVLKEVPEFKSLDIRYIWPEANGQTWICTYGHGFYLITKESVIAFPENNGRLAYVHSIIEDAKGHFWMPANNGLFVTSRESLMAYANNRNELPFFFQFSKKHGLRTNEFNGGGQPAFLHWANDDISLSSMQGLVHFNPSVINFNFSSSPIQVDNIQADTTEILQRNDFDIKNNVSNISFSLSSSFWGEKENDLLEYQVVEKGKSPGAWLQVDESGKVNLFTPSYGHYSLIVRKRKGLKANDYVYKEINFYVSPKWYQTKTFYVAAVLGILLLLTGIFFWRRNYYRRANRILKGKVDAATIELLQMNNTLEKKVEERTFAIQEAEKKFRTLVESSLVGVYIVQDDQFIYVNPRFENILGYDEHELTGTSVSLLIPQDQKELAAEKIRVRMSGEAEIVHYEIKVLKKDGSDVLIEVFGRHTIYEGKPTLIGTLLDITERKQMEIELREAELKFRDLVEKSMVGVYIIQDGKFAYVNPRLAEMFGYKQEELINTINTTELVDPESVAFVKKSISGKIEGQIESNNYEAKGLKKDGQMIWMEVYSSATVFQGKNAVIGSVLDITERKLAKEQLIKEKDLSQSIINSLPGVFYVFDQHGEYQLWNKNHEILTGYTAEEMSRMRPSDFFEQSELAVLTARIEKVFKEGYAELEAPFLTKDRKKMPYYFNGILINYNDKPCIMGVGLDVSERKKAEQEKEHANYLLNERIKELTTLYKAGLVLQREEKSILVTLQNFVSIVPAAYQYPNITEACIKFGEMEFITPGYKPGPYSQSATFTTSIGTSGKIDVVYLEESLPQDEGPFLAEERKLIDMLADMLRIYFTRREAISALQKSEANLQTIFDTTDTVYALLDKNFNLVAFNQRAYDFGKKELKKTFGLGKPFIEYFPKERHSAISKNMTEVMKGGHVSYEVNYPQPDGKVHWYYVRLFSITNTEKFVFGVMVAVSDITETKLLQQEILDQKMQEQKKVIRAILTGEEMERNKIGQELHDNVNQILAGTKLYLSMARKAKSGGEDIINESMELIDSAIEEIRALSKGKVTPMKKVNLEDLLQTLIHSLDDTTSLKINFTYSGSGQLIEDDLKLNIYRIIQEQLNNILKHAMAKNIEVRIEAGNKNIHVLVADDGKGFDPAAKKKGIGISNMINRVESFNGTITIESSPGNGCRLEINLPV